MSETVLLDDDTVGRFALTDASLIGIAWRTGGRDLEFALVLGDGRIARLVCASARAVRIDLDYRGQHVGYTLSWECRFERGADGWHMVFEFPPEGVIELDCTDARLEYEAAGTP